MAIIVEQRAQLFQSLGNIATSAANAVAEGIGEAAKTDTKTVHTALKLFGGFDRIEFENIYGIPIPDDGQPVPEDGVPIPEDGAPPNLLVPAVRPPASYEGPSEYFKPLSNTVEGQSLLVPAKDLLQQLEDPRFRMADGLSGFSANRITQTLAQKGMIINSKPSGDVSLGRLDENGIIIVGGKPSDPGDMVGSLDSFGKLYMMENTVGKQLQLHQQLDLSTFGNFSGAKQNPRLDRGLKGMPDAQAAAPQSKKMLDLTLDDALNGTPETVGEFLQMIDVLQVEVRRVLQESSTPFGSPVLRDRASLILQQLQNLEVMHQDVNPNLPPSNSSLEFFGRIREAMQQLLPIG